MNILFPHTLNDEKVVIKFENEIVRKENMISFSLPVKLNIKNNLVSRRKNGSNYIYVLGFESVNDALNFQKNPEIEVVAEGEKDVFVLESEMNRFMEKYEENEKKDENKKGGFKNYD